MPTRNKSSNIQNRSALSIHESTACKTNRPSTTFAELIPGYQKDQGSHNIAERRRKTPPPPLFVGSVDPTSSKPKHAYMEPVPDIVSPLSPSPISKAQASSEEYSSYSHGGPSSQQPGPLNVNRVHNQGAKSQVNNAVFDAYNNWVLTQEPSIGESSPGDPFSSPGIRRSKSTGEGFKAQNSPLPAHSTHFSRQSLLGAQDSPVFSPLVLYFRSDDASIAKRGEKTMIGTNGWLERTDMAVEKDTVRNGPHKKTGILHSIKKIAKDMVSRTII